MVSSATEPVALRITEDDLNILRGVIVYLIDVHDRTEVMLKQFAHLAPALGRREHRRNRSGAGRARPTPSAAASRPRAARKAPRRREALGPMTAPPKPERRCAECGSLLGHDREFCSFCAWWERVKKDDEKKGRGR